MTQYTEDELKEKVHDGYILESPDEMTPGYRKALTIQLMVQGDTELMSAPAYWGAAQDAPSTNTMVSAVAIIQDELAHANIAYRILEDMGQSKEELLYGREPHEFKHPYGFDQPLENWAELVTANGFFDRAGITLLGDVHRNTSYGPLKRALVKVDMEETFHLRHGEVWMRRLAAAGGEAKEKLQRAVEWMFPMTIEWFGLPDDLKRHSDQLDYKLKGMTNDELRQAWMSATVPLCEGIGIDVPAHYDDQQEQYVLEYPFPCDYDAEAKRWDFEGGEITWDEVFQRWKGRGPMNERYVESVRKSHGDVRRLMAA
ncbi:MAG: Phenylacetic acid catabolic protein [Longimicrobiales bacterium]|nr:Phenylacetic acid catabolic protein [Longimicrobiales bacterium]